MIGKSYMALAFSCRVAMSAVRNFTTTQGHSCKSVTNLEIVKQLCEFIKAKMRVVAFFHV